MKYFLTGAQGTGKTTIMNALLVPFDKIQGITRQVITQKNLPINENASEYTQKCIFDEYLNRFNNDSDFISERSLIDVVAYTTYLYKNNKVSKTFLEEQEKQLKNFINHYSDSIYFYLPILFDIQGDGVRSTDKKFQKEIDDIILSLLNKYKCSYFKLYDDLDGRISFITQYMNLKKIKI